MLYLGLGQIVRIEGRQFPPQRGNIPRVSNQSLHHHVDIIIDIGSEADLLQLSIIEDATAVLVVTTPEVLVVNQTRRVVNDLLAASVPGDFIQVILNKVARVGLDQNVVCGD